MLLPQIDGIVAATQPDHAPSFWKGLEYLHKEYDMDKQDLIRFYAKVGGL